jgi:hypothetical protein
VAKSAHPILKGPTGLGMSPRGLSTVKLWPMGPTAVMRAGPVSPYLDDPVAEEGVSDGWTHRFFKRWGGVGMGDLSTAGDAIHEAATRAIKGSIPVVVGMDGDSPRVVLPDILLLELYANGVELPAGEVFRRRDGRAVRVLPVRDVLAEQPGE